jgi:hypothetical protein
MLTPVCFVVRCALIELVLMNRVDGSLNLRACATEAGGSPFV